MSKKLPIEVLANTVLALVEWNITGGLAKRTYWMSISGELRKAYPEAKVTDASRQRAIKAMRRKISHERP